MVKTIVVAMILASLMACSDASSSEFQLPKSYDVTCYSGGQKVSETLSVTEVKQNSGTLEYKDNGKKIITNADCVLKEKN